MGTLIGDELLPFGSITILLVSLRDHLGNDKLDIKPFCSPTIGLTNIKQLILLYVEATS